jgi:putative endonuclease
MRRYWTYIMASESGTLYTGVTNDLVRRVYEHKHDLGGRFTAKYSVHKLVYFEEAQNPADAIAREKQIKGWRRARKVGLIATINPKWADLAAQWYA